MYITFRDQRVCVYFQLKHLFVADKEWWWHSVKTHIHGEFISDTILMCQLFFHKWSELFCSLKLFIQVSYQLNF